MEGFNILLVIIAVTLIIQLFWNIHSSRKFFKNAQSNKTEISDSKYWELKSKNEFIIAVFAFIIVTVGYLGYNSFDKANKEIAANSKKETDSISNSFRIKTVSITDSITKISERVNNTLQSSANKVTKLSNATSFIDNKMQTFKSFLDTVSQKNILKLNYYIIEDNKFNKDDWKWDTVYYKDLTTLYGDKLPEFTRPPVLMATCSYFVMDIFSATKDYFIIIPSMGYDFPDKKYDKSTLGVPYQIVIFY